MHMKKKGKIMSNYESAIGSIYVNSGVFIGMNANSISPVFLPESSSNSKSVTYSMNYGVPYKKVVFHALQLGMLAVKSYRG